MNVEQLIAEALTRGLIKTKAEGKKLKKAGLLTLLKDWQASLGIPTLEEMKAMDNCPPHDEAAQAQANYTTILKQTHADYATLLEHPQPAEFDKIMPNPYGDMDDEYEAVGQAAEKLVGEATPAPNYGTLPETMPAPPETDEEFGRRMAQKYEAAAAVKRLLTDESVRRRARQKNRQARKARRKNRLRG